jgi:hypothetical protein
LSGLNLAHPNPPATLTAGPNGWEHFVHLQRNLEFIRCWCRRRSAIDVTVEAPDAACATNLSCLCSILIGHKLALSRHKVCRCVVAQLGARLPTCYTERSKPDLAVSLGRDHRKTLTKNSLWLRLFCLPVSTGHTNHKSIHLPLRKQAEFSPS